jgi:hypothetical protein
MATFVLTAGYVALNGTDLSTYCSSIQLQIEAESKDTTTFGSSGWHEELSGIKSASLALQFKQDVAASALDSIMWPLFGTVVTFEVRATQSAVGTSNPKYSGSVNIRQWNPVAGAVGDTAEVSVTYPTTGTVARATS